MNGQSRKKSPRPIPDRQLQAALEASQEASRHRARHGNRVYRTRGDAYQAGYLLGYTAAWQFWHRQLYGSERGRQ